ncbi:MAG: hypothetical protein Q9172_004162 [Xanthocarpia lactea]
MASPVPDLSQYSSEYLAENNSQQLIDVIVAFGVLETIFLSLFIYARAISKTLNGADFWLIPAAYLGCLSHVITIALFVKYGGAGRHFVTVTPREFQIWLEVMFSEYFLYLFSAMLPKLAILSLYLRIFTQRSYRYATHAIAIIMILNWLTGCMMGILICKPIQYNWDKTIPGGHCGDLMGVFRWTSLPNLITDIAMLILPLPMVWKLHTGLSQKIGLSLTFITGSIGTITSVLRFATFFTTDLFSDPTWYVVRSMTWTCIEPSVYFIAATLPSLRPLVLDLFKGVAFRNLCSGNASGAGHNGHFSLTRQTKEISLPRNYEVGAVPAASSGGRGGFSKLDDKEVGIGENYT